MSRYQQSEKDRARKGRPGQRGHSETRRGPLTVKKARKGTSASRATPSAKSRKDAATPSLPRKQSAPAKSETATFLDGWRAKFLKSMRGYRATLVECVVAAYGEASRLRKSRKDWASFVAEPHWREKKKPPRESEQADALRFVLRWIFREAKRASFYHRAVAPLFDEGIEPENLASVIDVRGGLRSLADAHTKEKPATTPEKATRKRISAAKRVDNTKTVTAASNEEIDVDNDLTSPAKPRAKKTAVDPDAPMFAPVKLVFPARTRFNFLPDVPYVMEGRWEALDPEMRFVITSHRPAV